METADLQVSNEEKFRDDLVTYLQGKDLVDSMLPDARTLKRSGRALLKPICQMAQRSLLPTLLSPLAG